LLALGAWVELDQVLVAERAHAERRRHEVVDKLDREAEALRELAAVHFPAEVGEVRAVVVDGAGDAEAGGGHRRRALLGEETLDRLAHALHLARGVAFVLLQPRRPAGSDLEEREPRAGAAEVAGEDVRHALTLASRPAGRSGRRSLTQAPWNTSVRAPICTTSPSRNTCSGERSPLT